jgi:DNA-directed RNA polymerase subunit K/omega
MTTNNKNVVSSIEPRNMDEIVLRGTGNTYETLAIISKRANQITMNLKEEIKAKMQEFQSYGDSLEEVHENREQIEFSRIYEKMPNPAILSYNEFMEGRVYFRNPTKDALSFDEE